jgi:hypothetical protein
MAGSKLSGPGALTLKRITEKVLTGNRQWTSSRLARQTSLLAMLRLLVSRQASSELERWKKGILAAVERTLSRMKPQSYRLYYARSLLCNDLTTDGVTILCALYNVWHEWPKTVIFHVPCVSSPPLH